MESAAVLRSFHCSAGSITHARLSHEKLVVAPRSSFNKSLGQAYAIRKLTASARTRGVAVACAQTPATIVSSKSDIPIDDGSKGSTEKHALRATFPNAFEALLLEVCDETSVAEVQLKIGDFEMHLKRNVGATSAPIPVAPPIPSEPMEQSAAVAASASASAPKSSSEKASPFTRPASAVSSRLAALEASGVGGFKVVASPTVGSFQRGRTVKGKKQPPVCKKGDLIKEGQVIGYVDRFGMLLPVKSDVAGEVLKLLFEEGEAVGYGDPLVAVLPSFHGLN
ncbi:hypothetical protein RND81_10G145600 [Saponaria officinalis]|uniref:Lipoyl-binding domain-containing protein n=1 Tax=Saponaria officinalis TaxID=3572 RepID=A0AAW1I4I5_SAPOF